MNKQEQVISQTERYGAHHYHPLPIVIAKAEGVWVEDSEGKRYMDMLSGYSALNQGHRHPKIIEALKKQADLVTLTSRAFYNEPLGELSEQLAHVTGKNMILPMNTGAEAVETALKAARRWGYRTKGVPEGLAEIIVCEGNFHGRTLAVTSFSSEAAYRADFGPFLPGFKMIPFGDIEALRQAITPNTVALLIEPIQGEAGIIIPPEGFLSEAAEVCRDNQVLFMADEIQTGFGRTGKRFACDWENVVPDVYILGKALGGGVLPVSAVAADNSILGLFEPGSHGSTFGGNPLASAVASAALRVMEEEQLAERSLQLGGVLLAELAKLAHPEIKAIRGRGLFVAIETSRPARFYCEQLKEKGLLCKETHHYVIRLAPPLVITEDELKWAIEQIKEVFN